MERKIYNTSTGAVKSTFKVVNGGIKTSMQGSGLPFTKGTRLAPGAAGSTFKVPYKETVEAKLQAANAQANANSSNPNALASSSQATPSSKSKAVPPKPPSRNVSQHSTNQQSSSSLSSNNTSNTISQSVTDIPEPALDTTHGPPLPRRAAYKPFSEYTAQDKDEFFALLDEYFSGKTTDYLVVPNSVPIIETPTSSSYGKHGKETRDPLTVSFPASVSSAPAHSVPSLSSSTTQFNDLNPYRDLNKNKQEPAIISNSQISPSATAPRPSSIKNKPAAPPVVNHSTRPTLSSAMTAKESLPKDKASEAVVTIKADSSRWYAEARPVPPSLNNRNDIQLIYSWKTIGNERVDMGSAIFSDLSKLWWNVGPHETPTSHSTIAPLTKPPMKYAIQDSPPKIQSAQILYECSEKYGNRLAQFAQDAAQHHLVVGSGECWDLANDGLESVGELFDSEHPTNFTLGPCMTSIGRTHGHIVCQGTSAGVHWLCSDGYIRPGDIIEWRTVIIRTQDMNEYSHATLGDPEHTAIITSASVPNEPFAESSSSVTPLPLSKLGFISVIEQSQGKPCHANTYNMESLSAGQFWVYRPISQYYARLPLNSEFPSPDNSSGIYLV